MVFLSFSVVAVVDYEELDEYYCITPLHFDNFLYSTDYTDNGYSYVSGCAFHPNAPVYSDFYNQLTFGHNKTTSCTFGSSFQIRKDFLNVTNGIIALRLDYAVVNDSLKVNSPINAFLKYGNTSDILFSISTGFLNSSAQLISSVAAYKSGLDCKANISAAYPVNMSILFMFDIDEKRYSLYYKDYDKNKWIVFNNCLNVYGGQIDSIKAFALSTYVDSSELLKAYVKELEICQAQNPAMVINGSINCEYPILFCDNFDYSIPMFDAKNWYIYLNNFAIDKSYSPKNWTLKLSETGETYKPTIKLEPFNIMYEKNGYWYTILEIEYAPVLSIDFKLTINEIMDWFSDNCLLVKGLTKQKTKVFNVAFCGWNYTESGISHYNYVFYENQSNSGYYVGGDGWSQICRDCFNSGDTVKIITYFNTSETYKDLNSTIDSDKFQIFINDNKIITDDYIFINYYPYPIEEIKYIEFEKRPYTQVSIDDFYIYLGTDKDYDTTQDYIKETLIQEYEPIKPIIAGSGGQDLLTQITSQFEKYNLISEGSRYIIGLILLIVFIIVFSLIMAHIGIISPFIIAASAFIFSIILVFIKLLPSWLIIMFLVAGAGLLSLAVMLLLNKQ